MTERSRDDTVALAPSSVSQRTVNSIEKESRGKIDLYSVSGSAGS